MKKLLVLFVILSVAGFAFAGGAKEAPKMEPAKAVKNADTLVYATYGDIDSFDPAKAYDTASWTCLAVMYERLVAYDGSALDKFVPVLAEEVPTAANGGISADGKTYKFKIRKGVKFHNGYALAPEDVAYSFKRNMVVDVEGGPCWIWFNIFMGADVSESRDGKGNIVVDFKDIDKAVQVQGDYVVFTLKDPFPPFLSVVAGQWASILSRKWVTEQGGWDGTEATWKKYNNPEAGKETLNAIANGTGAYQLTRYQKKVEVVFDRFDGYWGRKPAIKTGIYKIVEEWSTRKLMLLQGDADIATVDPPYYTEMDKEPGITITKNLASLNVGGINFNMKIKAEGNPYIYSGKLDGAGVPSNFFSDKNVRQGFIAAWDEVTFLRDAMKGESIDPVTPIVKGLPYKNEELKSPPFDLKKAEEYLRKAWDGQVWEKGFKLDLLYNTGNAVREVGMKMLAENLVKLNSKFKVEVRAMEWADYTNAQRNKALPIFFIGWAPDFPDPGNYVFPYQHSNGTYAGRAGYKNEEVDKLIADASTETDPAKRKTMYYRLQQIWLDDAIGIMNSQALGRRYMKDWVQGFYFNPMHSSPFDLLATYTKGYAR
jgi:peptide/nickel transport system substrate-binding protein